MLQQPPRDRPIAAGPRRLFLGAIAVLMGTHNGVCRSSHIHCSASARKLSGRPSHHTPRHWPICCKRLMHVLPVHRSAPADRASGMPVAVDPYQHRLTNSRFSAAVTPTSSLLPGSRSRIRSLSSRTAITSHRSAPNQLTPYQFEVFAAPVSMRTGPSWAPSQMCAHPALLPVVTHKKLTAERAPGGSRHRALASMYKFFD